MSRMEFDSNWSEIDEYVSAFEQAHARDPNMGFGSFLPAREHPLYAHALRELVRVDLEYGWERGRPRSLSDYQAEYPELSSDPEGFSEIIFEEYRLRWLAGEEPSSEEYGLQYGDSVAEELERWRDANGIRSSSRSSAVITPPSSRPSLSSLVEEESSDDLKRAAMAYEAFRDEDESSDPTAIDAWCSSFRGTRAHAELFQAVHRSDPRAAARLARGVTSFPEVGSVFLGFRLIAEFGRGKFGRVYLAHQGELADRPVALKISAELFGESQTLARLQHTNIVPIYSVHQFEPYQAVCMPYLGATTLSEVLRTLMAEDGPPVSGGDLLTALHQIAQTRSEAVKRTVSEEAANAPVFRTLENLTYMNAVLWLVARLADGLAHAHDRGILHRDLKPANILLTDDGQPMLLDFNLSEDLKHRVGPVAAAGGTLPYMAPEQLDRCNGGTSPVDARSDIYALGIILFELLTLQHPHKIPAAPPDFVVDYLLSERSQPPPDPRVINPEITPAVASIVRKCLAPLPEHRYQSARHLLEDLDAHLADRPLPHAPEPSFGERIGKWTRRNRSTFGSPNLVLAGVALSALLGSLAWGATERWKNASAREHLRAFQSTFSKCQILLNTSFGPIQNLGPGIDVAQKALDKYGVARGTDWTRGSLVARLPKAQQTELREQVSEVIMLASRARVRLAETQGSAAVPKHVFQEEIAWLDEAERFDPRPSSVLFQERAHCFEALNDPLHAKRDLDRAAQISPTSARDFYLIGSDLLMRKQPDQAERWLNLAVVRDSRLFWGWFLLGLCHGDEGRLDQAAYDYSVCTVLAPDFAWSYLNRGFVLARAGRLEEALVDYHGALRREPGLREAYVNRALVFLELGKTEQALDDCDQALRLDGQGSDLLAARASALWQLGRRAEAEKAYAEAVAANPSDPLPLVARGHSRLHHGDPAGAQADFAKALTLDPSNARARLGRAYLLRRTDPRAALADIDRALQSDPNYLDALQLRALMRARVGDPAAVRDADKLIKAPTPERLYNAACTLALLTQNVPDSQYAPRALELLKRSLDIGFSPAKLATDPDLDSLRDEPGFRKLVESLKP